MPSSAKTVEEYVNELSEERKVVIQDLRKVILKNLPKGFKETMSYGTIGYVVPHSLYPSGYHCDPSLPLPFISIASQKNFIAFYHMGMYADTKLLTWFTTEFPKHSDLKLDMGKSCVRFKKINAIPFRLLGELCTKMSPEQWIQTYKKAFNK